jgi:cytochrome b subunit of formate dehydrogenase
MLLHNGGDWLRKLIRLRSRRVMMRRRGPEYEGLAELRMLPLERVQHALLAISFLVLIWTGFALKYPDQWWARPLMVMEGLRSVVHRVAAAMMIAVSILHVVVLMVNRRLRQHWKEMLPNVNDPREALANMAYNLGLGRQEPDRSSHSYVEKAEYWAVVWGTAVMVASGALLWANNIAMKLLPKAWLDVATAVHFYEAVLATLAIVVWHVYSVMFDPDVYPLDTAWLTGYSVKKHAAHGESEETPTPPAAD